jgi:hypothetical protein
LSGAFPLKKVSNKEMLYHHVFQLASEYAIRKAQENRRMGVRFQVLVAACMEMTDFCAK